MTAAYKKEKTFWSKRVQNVFQAILRHFRHTSFYDEKSIFGLTLSWKTFTFFCCFP